MNDEKVGKPEQISCNGVVITYFPYSNHFSIGLRELVCEDGTVLPSRIIPIDPLRIAKSKRYDEFARMLELMADRIMTLAAECQPATDV